MAKKDQKTEEQKQAEIVQERTEASKGKTFYERMIDSLNAVRTTVHPVEFEKPELQHLNGNLETKEGIFVRCMDIHEQEDLKQIKGARPTYHVPDIIIRVALLTACAFDGTRMFDENNQEHIGYMVGIPEFSNDIFWEGMFASGMYTRTPKDIAKNSAETLKPSSESGSQNNSEEQSPNSSTDQPSIES